MPRETVSNKKKYHPIVLLGALIGFVISMGVLHTLPSLGLMSAALGGALGAL